MPASVVITGCDSMGVLDQAVEAALTFEPLSDDSTITHPFRAIVAGSEAASPGLKRLYHSENVMQDNAIRALKKLHTSAIDARNGYKEALDDAKGRGLSWLFTEMVDLHGGDAEELGHALVEAGEQADENGSFMSVVHETIMDVRSLFGLMGKSILPGLIDGETRNVAMYDHALAEISSATSPFQSIVSRQRDRLAAKLATMKAEQDELKAAE